MNHTTDILYNSVFHDSFRLQIHRMFSNLTGDNKLYVVISDVRSRSTGVDVDVLLVFTRYLDAILFDSDDVSRLLMRHLATGKLGQFAATVDGFVCEELPVDEITLQPQQQLQSPEGAGRDVILLIVVCSILAAMTSALCVRCLRHQRWRQLRDVVFHARSSVAEGGGTVTNNINRTKQSQPMDEESLSRKKYINATVDDEKTAVTLWPTKGGKDINVNSWESVTKYPVDNARNLLSIEHTMDENSAADRYK
jgi:hypothetical protein